MESYRLFFVYLMLLLTTNGLYAQATNGLSGTVVLNDVPTDLKLNVGDVKISNLAKKISTTADQLGNFFIEARIGDSLTIYLPGIPKKYIQVKSYEHMTVYLDSTILLDEVNIEAVMNNRYSLEATAIEYSKKNSIYFGGRPPIALLSPFDGSPITFFRELLGKDGKKVRKFNRYIHQQIELNEIDTKFNTQIIKQVVTIEDNEIEKFKITYRPTLEEVKKWTTYDLYDYIKRSYQEFKKSN
ncbi:hypothetical protein RYH73_09830 [Olivibacter sp. CPCC 100613]|uniref:hypothetical protein n=1 Tax=Olivibacter sp. CPCC 100613 TaxID=3079931 RepID=UPI002FF759A9